MKKNNISIGVYLGFFDLKGFGCCKMDFILNEIYNLVIY